MYLLLIVPFYCPQQERSSLPQTNQYRANEEDYPQEEERIESTPAEEVSKKGGNVFECGSKDSNTKEEEIHSYANKHRPRCL